MVDNSLIILSLSWSYPIPILTADVTTFWINSPVVLALGMLSPIKLSISSMATSEVT